MLRASRDHSLLKRAGFPTERHYGRAGLLSQRESEVADLLCQGLTNKEIARILYISDSTAKVHVRHILHKLGARTRTEAVALYVPNDESAAAAKARVERHAWLAERDYRVVQIRQSELEQDVAGVLNSLEAAISGPL